MQRLFKCVALLALWMAFAATAAIEQYTLYLDTDGVTTGQCTAGSLSGADAKIDVSVDNSANAITAVTLATCSGTSYDTASALNTGDWSLSIGTGIDGSDVIQGRIPLAQLGNPTTVSILASSSAGGNSDMAGSEWVGVSIDTTTDTGDGNTQAVPALSTVAVGALLCLFLMVSIVAYRRRFGHYHWVLVMVCLPLVLSIAWALTWTTVINDAQETGNSGDIIQVRLANDSDYLYVQLSAYVGNNNQAPTDIALSNATVAENAAGAVIGTLSTTDLDSGDSHTYSVSDSRFEVSGNQLKLKAGQALDYEAETSVTLSMTATDSGGLTFNKDFTLTVTDDVSDNTSTVTAIPTKLNDTGITACATADGNSNSADCSTAVSNASGWQVLLGQDGHYGTGKDGSTGMVFSKVAGYEDKCVQDEHTGLMWEVKQTSGLHSADNTYSWYSTTNNGGNDGTQNGGTCTGSDCDTAAFVNVVNAAGWCGYHDWRLPTRRELRGIVDYSRYNPAIDTAYFPQTNASYYWSSSPYARLTSVAWGVYFGAGHNYYGSRFYKSTNSYVRLVRGGQ